MLKVSRACRIRRIGLKNRSETHDSSLARTKYATGSHFVLPSPNLEDAKVFDEFQEFPKHALPSRYTSEKEGHAENPIKDWLAPKPTRWQSEWGEYMRLKNSVEQAADEENIDYGKTDFHEHYQLEVAPRENFDWETEVKCFAHRIGLQQPEILTVEAVKTIVSPSKAPTSAKFGTVQAHDGEKFAKVYLSSFFKKSFPKLPEEAVQKIVSRVLEREYLHYQMRHTGIDDLEREYLHYLMRHDDDFYEEFGAGIDVAAQSETSFYELLEFVRRNSECSGTAEAAKLVQRLVLPGVFQKDVLRDLWQLAPNEAVELLEKEHGSTIEPRLINRSSSSEIIRVYHVGLYEQETKKFISSSYGESVAKATGDAALVALGQLYQVEEGYGKMYRMLI